MQMPKVYTCIYAWLSGSFTKLEPGKFWHCSSAAQDAATLQQQVHAV